MNSWPVSAKLTKVYNVPYTDGIPRVEWKKRSYCLRHQAAVLTAICPYPDRHILLALTDMTRFSRIAFIYYIKFFPKAQTLIFKHLHKAIKPPIIIHHAVADLSLALLFVGLVFLFLDDHLALGKIDNDHSSFSQCAGDEIGGFMQAVLLLATLFLRHAFVDIGEINVAARFLPALGALGANFIELFVVVAIAFEPAVVVEAKETLPTLSVS
jgi:hypothetical protein